MSHHPEAPAPGAPRSSPSRRGPDPTRGAAGEPPVALVDWPADEERRRELALAGGLRLLLVGAGDPPPLSWADREDWVRQPASAEDVAARVAGLVHRTAAPVGPTPRLLPVLDADRVLRLGDRSVRLPVAGARLLVRLLHDAGAVVARPDLVAAAWPHRRTCHDLIDEDLVDREVAALRPVVAPVGVELFRVGTLGYLALVTP
ncbi:hypothetical protein KSP35_09880 [Aquihabitans sp. G128]|uniref:hypothetical protein n=1 Tax=Aquihabitans sp. G128 TaxID=2849779 RepID=UPI001C215F7D|nr:hypothetical protein [Aquihabitans sp. G128]QXC63053.1 hypothetical protein KSP35_09880 [Aquihabitans sp. G128]